MIQGAEIKERLDKYLEFKGYKRASVERRAGLSNCYLKSSNGGFSAPKLADLASVCADLNMNWLITGRGEMLLRTAEDLSYIIGGDQINIAHSTGNSVTGKVVNEPSRKTFFDVHRSLDDIADVNIETVPQKHRGLVNEIKKYKDEIQKLKDELLSARSLNQELSSQLHEVKDELLNIYRQKNK